MDDINWKTVHLKLNTIMSEMKNTLNRINGKSDVSEHKINQLQRKK